MSEIEFLKPDEEIEPVLPVIPIAWRVLIRPYEVDLRRADRCHGQ
jgi:hypothetical protein